MGKRAGGVRFIPPLMPTLVEKAPEGDELSLPMIWTTPDRRNARRKRGQVHPSFIGVFQREPALSPEREGGHPSRSSAETIAPGVRTLVSVLKNHAGARACLGRGRSGLPRAISLAVCLAVLANFPPGLRLIWRTAYLSARGTSFSLPVAQLDRRRQWSLGYASQRSHSRLYSFGSLPFAPPSFPPSPRGVLARRRSTNCRCAAQV
jgi:hypothetical protein